MVVPNTARRFSLPLPDTLESLVHDVVAAACRNGRRRRLLLDQHYFEQARLLIAAEGVVCPTEPVAVFQAAVSILLQREAARNKMYARLRTFCVRCGDGGEVELVVQPKIELLLHRVVVAALESGERQSALFDWSFLDEAKRIVTEEIGSCSLKPAVTLERAAQIILRRKATEDSRHAALLVSCGGCKEGFRVHVRLMRSGGRGISASTLS